MFKTRAGATALRYGQLSAQDSTGTRLPTAMLLRNGVLELRVADRRRALPAAHRSFRPAGLEAHRRAKRALGTVRLERGAVSQR